MLALLTLLSPINTPEEEDNLPLAVLADKLTIVTNLSQTPDDVTPLGFLTEYLLHLKGFM